ncbi:hypothetical protein [Sphingomonas sp. 3-13AW]|uniref:hypothetical protein n=1 Tax=Sphingomonas sp. 3-13AW TaxID=3050450 RepID=UPI003BB55482
MRIVALLPLVILVSACGGATEAEKKTETVSEKGQSVTADLPQGVKPSAEVLATRKISGVWRSAPGVLQDAPEQIVQLEIAFDKSFMLTLWGKDPKSSGEAVFARAAGKIGNTKDGIAGSVVDSKPSGLSKISTWSAKLREDGVMLFHPSGGSPLELTRIAN